MTNTKLFKASSKEQLIIKNKECNLSNLENKLQNLNELTRNLLIRTLNVNPKRRPDAEKILKHKWFEEMRP